VVLGEAGGGVADGTDEAALEVVAAGSEVEHAVGQRIVEESVNGEIPARDVLPRVGFKTYGLRMAAVPIGVVGAKGGYFDMPAGFLDKDDAEVGADEIGVGEQLLKPRRRGVGGDVEIQGSDSEQQVADTAADEKRLMIVLTESADHSERESRGRRVRQFHAFRIGDSGRLLSGFLGRRLLVQEFVFVVARTAANLGRIPLHERHNDVVGKALALHAKIVDIVAEP
jgi:hypothetical protein